MPAPTSDRSAGLDAWLPEPQVRTHHRRLAAASPEELWRATAELRLRDAGTLGRLVRWRIPGLNPQITFDEMLRSPPFLQLERGPLHSISGLCGRIWTLARDYPELEGTADFMSWNEPETVRVLLAHWVEPAPGGRSQLVSEARVSPVDRTAAKRLRALWSFFGRFERLIGGEALRAAVRAAERP